MSRDPYKYFRIEARELVEGLTREALDVEKGALAPGQIAKMLRLAHTLKGASRVVRQIKIAELAHSVEDILSPYREKELEAISRGDVERLLVLFDGVSSAVSVLEPMPPPAVDVGAPAATESLRSVRIDIEEMDALLGGLFEVEVQLTALRKHTDEISHARKLAGALSTTSPVATRLRLATDELTNAMAHTERSLTTGLDRVDQEIAGVRDKAQKLRLVPASAIFANLERAVRDAAHSLKKEIHFETRGGDCRVEANVLFAIRDALLHVVRNAVTHGIESPSERVKLGKPSAGRVEVHVERRGSRIAFVCRDDGSGINVEAVLRAAKRRGAVGTGESAALSRGDALRLVLASGVSTTETVTDLCGRGVGLDVLRTTVENLKGDIVLASEAGRGTSVDVCIPLSVTSMTTLAFEAGGFAASVPLDSVRRALSVAPDDVARSAAQESIVVEGEVIPLLSIATALGSPAAVRERTPRARAAIVVHAGTKMAAIAIDRIVGMSSVVVRPMPRLTGPAVLVLGASLDAEGNPLLILDPRGLVEAAHTARADVRDDAPAKVRAPILIVDDSLTTRMLEQSILESAGYTVDLATSAEQATKKVREATYSLFLVDVEMPGMDGFEFVSRTRLDPKTRSIPAILVTSRDAAEDRRRGVDVGASGYVVKAEFDQEQLLATIRRIIG